MELSEQLTCSPVQWTDPRVRALLDAAAMTFYMPDDIKMVTDAVGLSPAELPWSGTPRRIWYKAFETAAKNLVLPELVGAIADQAPSFAARRAELEQADPPLPREPVDAPVAGAYKGFSRDAKRERQIVQGQPTLLDVRFLALGVKRATAVCRIEARIARGTSLGTGFLIGPRRVLTNHHVVFDELSGDQPASAVQVQFGKELDLNGRLTTPVAINGCAGAALRGERADDWAVIELDADPPPGTEILSISGPSEPTKVDDRVVIVQHPKGLEKKIGLAHNLVRYVDAEVMQYWTDTDEGSSGAPVFNEKWEVVALHHASVSVGTLDEYGYRNQGRTIGRIAARIADVAP